MRSKSIRTPHIETMTTTKEKTTTASTHTDTVEATATATMAPTIAGSPAPTAEAEPAEAPPHDECDECVLCCYPLPLQLNDSIYKSCCGETICLGCVVAQKRTLIIGTNVKKPIKGSKEEEREFMTMLLSEQTCVCPFCRTGVPENDTEFLERLYKQIGEYKDPKAMNMMGIFYLKGEQGLSKDLKKAEEVFKQAYDLDDPVAAWNLVHLYSEYIPDEDLKMKYAEEGAKRGNLYCMNTLAIRAAQSGNHEEAKRQFMTAACSGNDEAMENVMLCYRKKILSKDDLATTLRAHKTINDAGMSEPREYAMRHKAFEKKWSQQVQENGRRTSAEQRRRK